MTKAPLAGQVKTRLTPPLTPEEAAALNSCFLRDMATMVSLAAADGAARGIAIYTPAGAASAYVEILPPGFQLVPQRGEALEERLIFALEDLFQLGFRSACLINSDSPTLPPEIFAEAIRILAQPEETVVLGPTEDGGYYLIGLKTVQRELFEEIPWSTNCVLEETIERAQRIKLRVHLLPAWYDVDDHVTLQRLCAELFKDSGSKGSFSAPATRNYLEALLQRGGRERIWPNEEKS